MAYREVTVIEILTRSAQAVQPVALRRLRLTRHLPHTPGRPSTQRTRPVACASLGARSQAGNLAHPSP